MNEQSVEIQWVYLSSIFGLPKVPTPVAHLLRRVVASMVQSGLVSEKARWQALEAMAVNMLGEDRSALALGRRTRALIDAALSGEPAVLEIQTKDGPVTLVAVTEQTKLDNSPSKPVG